MDKETLHLWCAYPDDLLDDEAARVCLQLLSEDELARWQSFKFDRHRREYLATHALVRTALSHYHALPPEVWRFQFNAYGKPSVDPACGLRFNLSNSLGLVVCLIGEGAEVGVDVESHERAGSIAELGPRMFSPQELMQLEGLREDQRPHRCLQLWTLKEAYIKARGMGLAIPLNSFSFLFGGPEGLRMETNPSLDVEPDRWRFCGVEHAGHSVALVVEDRIAPELHVWEARPPSPMPRPLALAKELWYPKSLAIGTECKYDPTIK